MDAIRIDSSGIQIDGAHKVLLCASLFYFRIPREEWQSRIDMLADSGYNCIDVYFPWNFHETAPGVWDFKGMKDADAFLQLCREKGFYIVARPGPYICSEWDGGALPAWINAEFRIREDDAAYLKAVSAWFDHILPIIQKHTYDGRSGVILTQLENELDFFDCKTVDGYIGALRDMARRHGIDTPLFCCAGQLNAVRAGGYVDGVYPTYNFYPNSSDATYDDVFAYYNQTLAAQNLPLLISETNRDHFLLRRELSAGAKLLGAYNQVGGSNFGYTSSVNNWGAPLAFLSTKYDFASMVTTLGEYSPEVDEARLFASVLDTYGESLAASAAYSGNITHESSFTTNETLKALALANGGVVVCVPNFSEADGTIKLTLDNHTVTAAVGAKRAPFLPFGVKTAAGKTVDCANCELFYADKKTLAFVTDGAPYAVIDGKEYTAPITVDGVKILFMKQEEAFVYGRTNARRAPLTHDTKSLTAIRVEEGAPTFERIANPDATTFEQNGIYRGSARYEITCAQDSPIFVEDVADLITAEIDGAYIDSRTAEGGCMVYPPSKTGKAVFTVEKWGHSNFDDARRKSIRIASKKGAAGFYTIAEQKALRYFSFQLLDTFGDAEISLKDSVAPDTRIRVSQWNTTRVPVVCAYSTPITRTTDKLYADVDSSVENAVYVNGILVARGDYRYVDLTAATERGTSATLTVVYRKLDWAADCGTVTLLSLTRATVEMSRLTDTMMEQLNVNGAKETTLPLSLEKGKTYLAAIDATTANGCYFELNMRDAKATIVSDGHVVGRMIGEWAGAPPITGGSQTEFYVPAAWIKGGKLSLYIETLGDTPEIISLQQIERNA